MILYVPKTSTFTIFFVTFIEGKKYTENIERNTSDKVIFKV